MTKHIAIIGAGNVGTTTAYALCLKNSATTITLIDIDKSRCKGEILDLNDAIPFSHTACIVAGDIHHASCADIIIITAGRAQLPDQSREQLINTNKAIIHQIMTELKPKQTAIIIMVTNPVDTLTYYAQMLSNLPPTQIIGSGTLLDTQRLKQALSQHTQISPQSITALMLGEHGDTQFPFWSGASIQGLSLTHFGITKKNKENILEKVRTQVYEIIACKGATYYGIAMCLTSLCEIILMDQHKVVPVSCFIEEFDLCLSLPVVLAQSGIQHILLPDFNQQEKEFFVHCTTILKRAKQALKID